MKKVVFPFVVMLFAASCSNQEPMPSVTITNEVLNPVNDHLFGQFLEKCSWGGEIGGDLVINPETGEFDPRILGMLKQMNIPNLRFPGGTDVDYYDWTDMIDHAPGQTSRNPYYAYRQGDGDSIVSDNRLGFDEFLALCDTLGAEPILVLNIGDAFLEKESIEEARKSAASLWSYCNAAAGSGEWATYRELNGRRKPYDVQYFEIGNEYWGFEGFNWKGGEADTALVKHLFECIRGVADTLLALDPGVKIIVDGPLPGLNRLFEQQMQDKISYIVFHPYLPWNVNNIVDRDGNDVDPESLGQHDLWKAWVSTPAIDSATGFSKMFDDRYTQSARNTIFPVACTEWNWNGWLSGAVKKSGMVESDLAKGIGAAGFLHSFMREGEKIEMAMQSMLLGKSWGITGIRVDPEYQQDPVFLPSFQVTGLYSNYHGNERLKVRSEEIPVYAQPLTMNALKAAPKVAYLDIVATRTDDQVYLHVINRNYTDTYAVDVQFEGLTVKKQYKRLALIGEKSAEISNSLLRHAAHVESSEFTQNRENLHIQVPESSVSVFVFDLQE